MSSSKGREPTFSVREQQDENLRSRRSGYELEREIRQEESNTLHNTRMSERVVSDEVESTEITS